MLALWMFGVELERMWGTRSSLKFYFVCGVGAALTHAAAVVRCRCTFGDQLYYIADDRRLGRDLRRAARLRAVLPEPADLHVLRVPGAGEVLRDDHGRASRCCSRSAAAAASRTPRTSAAWSPATST